jgi:YgiT-type zinc finger domain-containing protein
MTSPKRCVRCRGPLDAKDVEHPYWDGSTLVAVVHGVPSWVCRQCGYHHFDSHVEVTLRHLVKDYEAMGTVFPIPTTPYREIFK